jgi:hypothetical protein
MIDQKDLNLKMSDALLNVVGIDTATRVLDSLGDWQPEKTAAVEISKPSLCCLPKRLDEYRPNLAH